MWSERSNGTSLSLEAQPFRYRQAPADAGAAAGAENWSDDAAPAALQPEELRRQAFEQGRQQGEAQARAALQAEVTHERNQLREALHKFKLERDRYFAHIESDVVHLALAIARKILHREAQMDPLLLTGIVRVALEKLESGTRVRLRAHPGDIRAWAEYFAMQAEMQGTPGTAPELIGDANLRRGECTLETEAGSTQVSLEGQLKEIEQGFADLLEQRPHAAG